MGFLRGRKANVSAGRLLGCLLVFIIFAAVQIPLVRAADTGTSGQGIQISPVLIDLNAEKGKSYTLKLTVTNVTAGTLSLNSAINDFRAKDETGNPEILLNDKEDNSTYSLKNWISPIGSLTLKSKESRTVSFSIDVPSNAEAGGHYGVIRFSGLPPDVGNKNVAINASVGVLILTRVEGNLNEGLKLQDFYVAQNGKKKVVLEGTPFTIVTRVQNSGNVHVKPIGHVTVKNFFGKTISTLEYGDNTKNVLPNSTRRFDQELKNKWLFGRYTMSLEAAYGTTGKVLIGSASFWVIPYKLILVILVLSVLAFIFSKRALKKYHARILRKHGHNRSQGH